jgi:heme-degrading monooxygenase HmoA
MPEKGDSVQLYRSKDGKSRYVVISLWSEIDQFISFAKKRNADLVIKT